MRRNALTIPWRKIHLFLALFSGLFLLIAAATGLVLSFEPIAHAKPPKGSETILLSDLLETLSSQYLEVFSLSRDNYGITKIEAIGELNDGSFYINPFDGTAIDSVKESSAIFDFCRDLHRSLFLKNPGRFLVGLASLSLLFLTLSGLFLIIKRMGDFRRFFHRIIVLDFNRDNHARMGRLFLIPIAFISLTATFLFFDRFKVFPATQTTESLVTATEIEQSGNQFEKIELGEVKEILFPLSADPEEYYEVKLKDRTLYLDQANGSLISAKHPPLVSNLHDLSFKWHTGEGLGNFYSLLLLLSSFAMLFFLYSGFKMSIVYLRKKPTNNIGINEATYVILVGSETGHSYRFAHAVFNALKQAEESVFMTSMNQMKEAAKMKHLLIMTSTYGDGDAPANANRFLEKIEGGVLGETEFSYSVLGFGSKSYPYYCQFAFNVHMALSNLSQARAQLNIHTVDNLSVSDFLEWLKAWKKKLDLDMEVDLTQLEPTRNPQTQTFEVIGKSNSVNREDDTFMLELNLPDKEAKIKSGDLLGVYMPKSNIERYYSIAFIRETGSILLSIKKTGLCSTFLHELNSGNSIEAFIKPNPHFYPGSLTKDLLLIGNGTGIAPFIGFIENNSSANIRLLWGGQSASSFALYQSRIKNYCKEDKLHQYELAFSRENPKTYVQDLVILHHQEVGRVLSNGGKVMICGSIKMRDGVLKNIEKISQEHNLPSVSELLENRQILSDCY